MRISRRRAMTYHILTHITPRDYVPASGESSAARRTTAARQKENRSVSGESSKVLSAPDQRPFGKTNRLSIIDGDEKTKGTPAITGLHVEHAVADLLR